METRNVRAIVIQLHQSRNLTISLSLFNFSLNLIQHVQRVLVDSGLRCRSRVPTNVGSGSGSGRVSPTFRTGRDRVSYLVSMKTRVRNMSTSNDHGIDGPICNTHYFPSRRSNTFVSYALFFVLCRLLSPLGAE